MNPAWLPEKRIDSHPSVKAILNNLKVQKPPLTNGTPFTLISLCDSSHFPLPHQEACLQGNLIANCLEQLSDPHPLLRQWVAICLGRIWQNFDPARWCGVRDSAHEKLYTLLSDPIPEVRG